MIIILSYKKVLEKIISIFRFFPNNIFNSSKKGISPIIATILLLIIGIVAVIGFQNWFQTFQSGLFVQVEQDSPMNKINTQIKGIVGNELYFRNSYSNLTITDIKIDGISCGITPSNYPNGFSEINIGNCTENITSLTPEILVLTNKGIFSKKVYLKNVNISQNEENP